MVFTNRGTGMQDRYAGDIGDFGKIALLRELQRKELTIGINWYKTEPLKSEKNPDGSYKQKDGKHVDVIKYSNLDQDLADSLDKINKGETELGRTIEAIQNEKLIPDAEYYDSIVTVENREKWHDDALKTLEGKNVVFLDPDNGLLVRSVTKKSARSVKYAFYDEVEKYIKQNQSVIIYNHRARKPKDKYFKEITDNLINETRVPKDRILKITFNKGTVRAYFAVCVSDEHKEIISRVFNEMANGKWSKICYIPE